MTLIMMLSMVACSKSSDIAMNVDMKWEEILEVKRSTVTFYGWGGDEDLNAWLDNVLHQNEEKYDITMERVPMDIDQVLNNYLEKYKQVKKMEVLI